VLYADQTSSAEQLVAQVGAMKAGVSIVTFAEKESQDALDHALASTSAKGLIFAPDADAGNNQTRNDFVQNLMPELRTMYFGDSLSVKRYPHLQNLVQTGFKAIRGVNMFKDLTVYASPQYSPVQIPVNNADDVALINLKNGQKTEYTSGELVQHSQNVWDKLAGSSEDPHPVFMSADLETPLGFATFLACSANFKKVYISGTYNMSNMLKQLPIQKSSWMVCDEELYSVQAPQGFSDLTLGVKNVVVGGKAGSTDLFKHANVQSVDTSL